MQVYKYDCLRCAASYNKIYLKNFNNFLLVCWFYISEEYLEDKINPLKNDVIKVITDKISGFKMESDSFILETVQNVSYFRKIVNKQINKLKDVNLATNFFCDYNQILNIRASGDHVAITSEHLQTRIASNSNVKMMSSPMLAAREIESPNAIKMSSQHL